MFDSENAVGVGQRWTRPLKSKASDLSTIELNLLEKDVTQTQIDDGLSPRSYRPLHPSKAPVKARTLPSLGPSNGWKSGALHIACWTTSVFLINLIVTIWGSRRSIGGGVLFQGDCKKASRLDTGLHILINVLSTVLLSGSNYCMQCLSAPTRREVDKAHAKGTWLHIGIPSLRNMRYISKRRAFLWCLLGLTSLPLHLFYNSAVFSSISSNSYYAFQVSQSFIDNAECTNCTISANETKLYPTTSVLWPSNFSIPPTVKYSNGYPAYSLAQRDSQVNVSNILEGLHKAAHLGKLERLDPLECVTQYATVLQTSRRNLLLVASDSHFPTPENNTFRQNSQVYWADDFSADSFETYAYSWMCSGLDQPIENCMNLVPQIKQNPQNWRVGINSSYSAPVEYCLSETAVPHCKVQFDTTIAVLVTVLNFVKTCLMIYIAFFLPHEPLVTMGDAVASFLSTPDPTTEGMCLFSQRDFRKKHLDAQPRQWRDRRYRWKDATGKAHRATTIILIAIALSVVIWLLVLGIGNVHQSGTSSSASSLAHLGYGTIDPRTSLSSLPVDSMIAVAFIANSAQVILSMLYFAYNSLLTAMLLGYEWTTYAQKRKGLRVSFKAKGEQRSKYFLQLPYRFGGPLLLLSGLLHWFTSQSIFVVAIEFWDAVGNVGNDDYSSSPNLKTCGYSPIAIISVIVLGGTMLVAIVAVGFIPYKGGMTLAGSCSMAMSAACHPASNDEVSFRDSDSDSDERAIALEKVQWGVMGTSSGDVGHCGFSAEDVSTPVKGYEYAGLS